MQELLLSYLPVLIFMGVALAIGLALLIAPFIVAYKAPNDEKLSAYECGFNAFDDARMKFDVRFISSPSCSSFLTSRSPSFSRGPSASVAWAGLVSGR